MRRRLDPWRAGLAGFGGLGLALTMTVLSYAQDLSPRPAPGPLLAQSVPLDARDPAATRLGRLDYAGGLVLSAGSSSAFSGLSDLIMRPLTEDRLEALSVTDEGQIVRFEVELDAAGRLAGASNLTMADLHENGRPVGRGKAAGDAEGLTFADGEYFVSFEVDNRVLAMADPFDPTAAVRRVPMPAPVLTLPTGQGLEALTAADFDGQAMLALGAETGEIWLCPRRTETQPDCRQALDKAPGPLFSLTALTPIPGTQDFLALYRSLDPLRSWRGRIEHLVADGGGYRSVNLAEIEGPLTVDNFEGIALLPLPGRDGWRIYIVSDDNFLPAQRTLLMAFDWRR